LDDFEITFGPNNLTLFELHRYTKNRDPDLPRDSVLVIKLRESDSNYYLTILELGKVICKREQVSSFEFLGNKFLCSLKSGKHFNFEILLADYMQQIISDLFELYKIKNSTHIGYVLSTRFCLYSSPSPLFTVLVATLYLPRTRATW